MEYINQVGKPYKKNLLELKEAYKSVETVTWEMLHPLCGDSEIELPYATTSMLCNQEFMDMPFAQYWSKRILGGLPSYQRKYWEWIFICQALYERGFLKAGMKGLAFGVGEECLPDLFASYGCDILATDLSVNEAQASGWVESNQNAAGNIEKLRKRHFCDDETFYAHVKYMDVNMNYIPEELKDFDFCWSSCSLEHLGSLRHGLDFILNSTKTLKKGGIAVHTTEFNLFSDAETFEDPSCSLYRRRDILQIKKELEDIGCLVEPIDWYLGTSICDDFIDLPPFGEKGMHMRLMLAGFPCTSIGLIIRR